MMADPRFIHLRIHSEYSLLEGAIHGKQVIKLCAKAGMPAAALTDTNVMFGCFEFSSYGTEAGLQPIVGVQLSLTVEEGRPGEKPKQPAPVVLLAQNETGYMNLMALSTCMYVDNRGMIPQVSLEQLQAHSEGLICLTGGADGPVGRLIQAHQMPKAQAYLERLAAIFPDRLYVELQRHPGEGGHLPEPERMTERPFIEMAYDMALPLVATNEVFFATPDMFEAHDAMLCIAEGAYVDQQEPRRRVTPQHYFKSEAEMVALFADLPEACENTVEIARRCAFVVYKHKPLLPKFADDEMEELRAQAWDGLRRRLAVIPLAASVEDYEARLKFELSIIEQMGFPGYFLIVADFIKWAKAHDIPVGPGRGSGAGSLVAYSLTITDLDPIRFSLLFERFLNPERVNMPDFDVDFCMDRREEVIKYVQHRYGADKVGQISAFGALLSKVAVRDVGRVLQMSYGQVDKLAKLIPLEGVKPVSIEKALADEPRLREAAKEEVVDRLLTYAQKIEGNLRNASTHAAGVVIGDRPLDQLTPLYQDPRSDWPATQYNMKWVEKTGLIKYDFLGLKTLTVIQNAVNLVLKSGRPLHVDAAGNTLYEPAKGAENDIGNIPIDDKKTYELYARAHTVAVFQVESTGMMDALRRMKPTCIEDIVALVALYRPGPMENIPVYCEVKHGMRPLESLHPTIDPILKETQGIIVYQEQVMQIAQVMAGYSLGGADLLRRAMGKKIPEEMAKERPKFIEGAKATHGIDAKKSGEVFDLLEKFANYGFNKSHAAAYAIVSYQTAWLKANHPVEFMAGVMNCDMHLTDKLANYMGEVRRALHIEVVPPCVNRSLATFDVVDQQLVYALGALKNVGPEAMNIIVEARGGAWKEGRPFADLFDFARRVDMKRIGKRPLEMMARAGAFDQLDPNRKRVFDSLEGLIAWSAAVIEQRSSAQVSLFGDGGDDLPPPRLADTDDWLPAERLAEEHKAIGFYLSGHPLDDYLPALRRKKVLTYAELCDKAQNGPFIGKIAGQVAARQERKSAKGNRFAFVSMSDPTGPFEVTVFSDTLEATRQFLEPGLGVILTVKVDVEGETVKMLAQGAQPIDSVVSDADGSTGLLIHVEVPEAVSSVAALLARIRDEGRVKAQGPIVFSIDDPASGNRYRVRAGAEFPINPQVKGAIRSLRGVALVEEI
ncbi:DNA polymerase III subunit alpha [Paenirhodobacter enshiensis]|uniref:DNA polymerase III subunit alpha n=1 Tax=Paenirhodobacter enshiensis TaxID=1105367 RepID=UPI003FA1D671